MCIFKNKTFALTTNIHIDSLNTLTVKLICLSSETYSYQMNAIKVYARDRFKINLKIIRKYNYTIIQSIKKHQLAHK